MRSIDLGDDRNWLATPTGERFLALGPITAQRLHQDALDRVFRRATTPREDVWGTLGPWQPSSGTPMVGRLRCSRRGEWSSVPEESGDETLHLVGEVNTMRGQGLAATDAGRIVERFVSLSGVRLGAYPREFSLETQLSLRLTVFVQSDEGALVYLERGRHASTHPQIVQPHPTGDDFSCSGRDRLTYRIPIWPKGGFKVRESGNDGDDFALRPVDAKGGMEQTLVIKVLVFKRKNSTSHEVLKRALQALGRDKYALQLWDRQCERFRVAEPGEMKRDKKTLLLLHGTFSSTKGSFAPLIHSKHGRSWLNDLLGPSARYQQLAAFDHDTVFDGLPRNGQRLRDLVGDRLEHPVDLITHSRGGLLGKHLALYGDGIEVDRAALNACANGVGYFALLNRVSWLLTILSRIGKFSSMGRVAIALGQHSAKFVLGLEGLQPMVPGSPELNAVMRQAIPADRQKTVFLPVVGDWKGHKKWYRQLGTKGIDLMLKAILGGKHDWVVGSREQGIVAPGHAAPGFGDAPLISSRHITYFEKKRVLARVGGFLKSP